MLFTYIIFAVLALVSHTVWAAPPKAVFAHMIMGNSDLNDWLDDIQKAKDAHIDAFAMNIGVGSDQNLPSLQAAYQAANQIGGFGLFISFDYMANGAWDAGDVVNLLNTFKDEPSQFKVDGIPLVSTFEGANNGGDWTWIKQQLDVYFVPCWSTLGAADVALDSNVDGGFSWNAWPDGASDMESVFDKAYIEALGDKSYMMPVSPWFYTNLASYEKNWVWRGDDLWFDRWQQIIELQPAMVEIISWNDVGESHHIGPIRSSGVPEGAWYVDGMDHEHFRDVLPYFIDQYKNGNSTAPTVDKEGITYYYRVTPADACSNGGTTGNDPAYQATVDPNLVVQDNIYVDALVSSPAWVTVQIGNNPLLTLRAMHAGVNHFSVPFSGQTGNVTVGLYRDGTTLAQDTGLAITTDCPNGMTNYNAFAGGSF
ncbi:glycoside hydrolase family 71 protein [Xylona heveae TC161]|uniref:Glycoside hydrolase family 71 protein n=1 Tax=Xylona heveae (strain CBS 132557 / TC161) TaxID=1328760 RepID=A0A165K2P4_XYLHT|nr:glycoside hydrolase family 71 protein [Xylona heveae TC161]KZF26917.1 glycoside hydrolase family 71 protein [Xylona heveae TC161]